MSFAFGRPSCGRALYYVGAPNLRMCLAFALWTCVGVPNLGTCLAWRWGTQLAYVPCIAFGHPTCGHALLCVGVPNLRTCLALGLGTHLADAPCVALGCTTLVT